MSTAAKGLGLAVLCLLLDAPGVALGSEWLPDYVVAGQSTVVWQHLPPFRSPYRGRNSLRPGPDDAVSHSYTVYTGLRLLPWLDLYVDPEMIRGGGLSDALGLAGFTNGEVIRNPSIGQDPYLGRAFFRLTVPLGGDTERSTPDPCRCLGAAPCGVSPSRGACSRPRTSSRRTGTRTTREPSS